MSVAHTAPDIYPTFADINWVSAKAKKVRGGELISPRGRTKHRKIEIADSFVDALFSDLSHLEQNSLNLQNDCGAASLSNGHEFTLLNTDDIEIADGRLDFSASTNDNVATSKTRTSLPIALISLICHAAIAGVLLFAGFTVTRPLIEGGEAVAITIVGDTMEKSSVAGATPKQEPVPPVTVTTPVKPKETLPEPAPVAPVVEPVPPKSKPVATAMPTETILTTQIPSATSVIAPTPLVVKPTEPIKPAKVQTPSPPIVAKTIPKIEPVTKPLPPIKKAVQKPAKAKAAKQHTEMPPKPAKKIVKETPAKNAGAASNVKARNSGKGAADHKQGSRDGAVKGVAAQKSAGAKSGAAGNADASNYAGLVQRKISRTRQRQVAGRGQVVVSFTVSASGGASGISIASSSGNPNVDAAAMDHIRRSSPFPAPPAGAQTRFQIPIRIN